MSSFRRVSVLLGLVLSLVLVALPLSRSVQADWLVNGDFEDGNTGFSSDYRYSVPPASGPIYEAEYTVWTDPNEVHSKWVSFGDHTTGNGNMLLVNGSRDADDVVWRQKFTFSEGITYEFSAWATGVYPSTPAVLDFKVAGMPLGTLELTETVPDWRRFSATFTAVTSGIGEFAIRDLSTAAIGNDFALDDISLVIVIPEPATPVLLSFLGMCILLRRRRCNQKMCYSCENLAS